MVEYGLIPSLGVRICKSANFSAALSCESIRVSKRVSNKESAASVESCIFPGNNCCICALKFLSVELIISLYERAILSLFGAIILFDELIVSILFGEGWDEMGFLFKGSFFWVLSVFISVPILSLLSITKNQKQDFKFQITLFSSRLIALLLGYYLDSFKFIFIIFCIASALPYLFYMKKTLNILSIRINVKQWVNIENILNITVLLVIIFLLHSNINILLYYLVSVIFITQQLYRTYKEFTKLNMDL